MTTPEVDFYLRHRKQITDWAALEKRVDDLMTDAISQGERNQALKLLRGESGDAAADFYLRNRALVLEWHGLQAAAASALHHSLLAAAHEAGCEVLNGKKGWTQVLVPSPSLDAIRREHGVSPLLAWTRQHLLASRGSYPFPRLALEVSARLWTGERRAALLAVTAPLAERLAMKKRAKWWAHWRMMDAIKESEGLESYSSQCIAALREAAGVLEPALPGAITSSHGK